MKQADRIIRDSAVDNLDILVLPEMAFSGTSSDYFPSTARLTPVYASSGYYFASLQEIEPFLEPTASGPSTVWAKRVAKQLRCSVMVGYPEKNATNPVQRYSSCVMVSETGEVTANYRKSSLYFQDETWADEGEGFFARDVDKFGQVAIGICKRDATTVIPPSPLSGSWCGKVR